jgi:pimeloyl-ACP methyl ester carboxylesterase
MSITKHDLYDFELSLPHIKINGLSNTQNLSAPTKQSPLILFLHGYLDNASSFETLLPYFESHICIAIDMAGHGHSQHRPLGAHYHLSDYAYDLHELIEALAWENVVLVGHSLGGIVSAIYAATQTPQLKGFIAIESIGPLSESSDTSAQQISACFKSRSKANKAIKQPSSLTQLVKARCAISDLSENAAELILKRNTLNQNDKITWRTDKYLRTQSALRMTEAQSQNILDNIMCPRALVIGSEGFSKIKRILAEREEQFVNVRQVEIAGGHHVHMDSPELCAKFILKFIDELNFT